MSNKKLFMVQTQADLNTLSSIPEGSIALVYDEDKIYEYKDEEWKDLDSLSEANLNELKELISSAINTANEAEQKIDAFLTGAEDSDEIINTLIEIQNYIDKDTNAFIKLSSKVNALENKTITWNDITNKPNVKQGEDNNAVVIGNNTQATKSWALATGEDTVAQHFGAYAGGLGTQTSRDYQTVIGTYNADDEDNLFVVGNGTKDQATDEITRSNAFEVKANGEVYADNKKLATEEFVKQWVPSDIDTQSTADKITFTKDILMFGNYQEIGNLKRNLDQPFDIIPTKDQTLQWLLDQIFIDETQEKQPKLITTTELGIQYNDKDYTAADANANEIIQFEAETGTRQENFFNAYCIPGDYQFEYGMYSDAYENNKKEYLENWSNTKDISVDYLYFTIHQEIPTTGAYWDDAPSSSSETEMLTYGTKSIKSNIDNEINCIFKDDDYDKISINLGLRIRNGNTEYKPATNLGNKANLQDQNLQDFLMGNISDTLSSSSFNVQLKGYRNIFYGACNFSEEEKESLNIDSQFIRNLKHVKAQAQSIKLDVNTPSNYFIVAMPSKYTLSKAQKTQDGISSPVEFSKQTIEVEGASEGYAMDYNVYMYSPDTNYNNLYLTLTIK